MGRRRTGSVTRRGGSWYARVTLHREPRAADGRAPRHEEKVTRVDGRPVTEAFAKAHAARVQALYDQGTWAPPGRLPSSGAVTVGAWVDAWLRRQRYTEAVKDRARVAAWLPRTTLERRPVAEVTPRVVADWLDELRQIGRAHV